MEGSTHFAPAQSSRKRRDKLIVSCAYCRGHKLRCDRQSPCSTCKRRGKPAECTYLSSEQERRSATDYRPRARNQQQARQRIARLESLVTEMRILVPTQNASDTCIQPPSSPKGSDMGSLGLTENSTVYTGSSHWATILEDIKNELSEEYANAAADPESNTFAAGSMQGSPTTGVSLLNSASCLSHEQILSMIPPRRVVDRHVSHFFNAFEMGPFFLHRKTFLAEYASFWDNPSLMPIMWIGLLFSVMSMSAFLQRQDVRSEESQDALTTYRNLTIQCLIAGDYLRPSRYTLETLTLHFGVEQNVNFDASIGNWILVGVVIRIALRMGLHRDPSHWNIKPLQAELRRRLWVALYQMDFFTSTQVGLPRIIKDSQCDTRLPTHLLYDDLGQEHVEMPSERSLSETTVLLHIIQRHAIIKVAAEIYDATEAGLLSAATTAALGAKLEKAAASLPANRSVDASIMDNPGVILNNMFLDVLVHKAVYLLHRQSFMKGYAREDSTKSSEQCLNATLAILDLQQRIDDETQPGGLLYGIRWRVASSLNQEFLQATMMLCLAMSRCNESRDSADETANPVVRDRQADIVQALTSAKTTWEKNTEHSTEARKAAKAISAVLHIDTVTPGAASGLDKSDGILSQLVDTMPGSYFDNFEYGQNSAFDPFFFAGDNGMAEFSSTLDDFEME